MPQPNPALDPVFAARKTWRQELLALRAILLDSPLCEEMKWGKPCYGFEGSNVAILYGMKAYCGLGFFKGALLEDPSGVLHQQGEHSQAVRLMRFTTATEIARQAPIIRAYIAQAIAVEKAGLKIDFKEKHALVFPPELLEKFARAPEFEAAFKALTPGRQRAYCLHFSGAKQAATRAARIEKSTQDILDGKGWNERPRKSR
jgi:uncharacterized protein YdeI (YjbR/CyaY-like superfamily)